MGEEMLFERTVSYIRKFVLVIIISFVIYHSILHLDSKADSCEWLLQRGTFVADYKWQPFGCLSYNYNKTDSKLCLSQTARNFHFNTHLVFAGDTRILQLYHYIVEHKFAKSSHIPRNINYSIMDNSFQHDDRYEDSDLGLTVDFKWAPSPSELYTRFHEIWQTTPSLSKDYNSTRKIVVIGDSLWFIYRKQQQSHETVVDALKTNMTRLLTLVKNLKNEDEEAKILWVLQDAIVEKKVTPPYNTSNFLIDQCNHMTEDLVRSLSIKDLSILSSHRAISMKLQKYINDDGIHSSGFIIEHKVQILLNYICNRAYGYENTCCSSSQKVNYKQMLFMSMAALLITIHLFTLLRPCVKGHKTYTTVKWEQIPQCDNTLSATLPEETRDSDEDNLDNALEADDQTATIIDGQFKLPRITYLRGEDLLMNLAKVSLIIVYMFICDQTNFFMKENKYFTLANFILPLLYMFALGIFFTEAQPESILLSCGPMLSKNQTNEWKGWMQLVVLIYNLSRAENSLRIYMLIRVLVSSYLFLTGFGHFTYFYKTGDLSMRRFFQVIFRLNFLITCLCVCMNRPYQYYYFVPLVTFWFLVIFLTMKIKPIKSPERPTGSDHFWLIFKLALLIGTVTMLYLSEVFFEKIFLLSWWKFLFTTSSDGTTVKTWWYHWSVDRYSVLAGMIYGLIHWTIISPYLGFTDMTSYSRGHSRESSQGSEGELVLSNPFMALQDFIKPKGSVVNTMALIGISFYILFAATCSDKGSCDEVHAYVSFVPIICFLILRNANEFLRNRHSILFAFIGRISLELSLCQYHIWLASGQEGLLVLVPSNPTLNLVITSIIFVTLAHTLNSINKQVNQYVTSSD